jgi:hypothetical protein
MPGGWSHLNSGGLGRGPHRLCPAPGLTLKLGVGLGRGLYRFFARRLGQEHFFSLSPGVWAEDPIALSSALDQGPVLLFALTSGGSDRHQVSGNLASPAEL